MNRSEWEGALPHRIDRFQRVALDALDEGRSVLVAAPTGSGKTLVADYAIDAACQQGLRSFYTTPIKALSNQKFRDLGARLGPDRVGLLTGDNSINGDAQTVVMTTEVLRNMIYAGRTDLDDLGVVVLDEVHYLQDGYRGPVWEEVILQVPAHVVLVCLSATVSNASEVGEWLETVRGPTSVVVEETRPVELDHLYLVGDRSSPEPHLVPVLVDNEPNPEAARFDVDGFSGDRGRKGSRRGRGRGKSSGRPRRRFETPDRLEVLRVLTEHELLPAIVFVFSRAGCDDAMHRCLDAGVELTDAAERERIGEIIDDHVTGLTDADLEVLGFARWRASLEAGVAAHHAGMVPPFKEAVEACFIEGLVRLVFATETLALGVNMPARSVVIERMMKFNGERREFLTPSEYTQLTGRAGRRGIDDRGAAVALWAPQIEFNRLAQLAASRSFRLTSAFRPTFNMAVNLVRRVDPAGAHDVLGRSFAQFQADRSIVQSEQRLRRKRQQLADLRDSADDRAARRVARLEREIRQSERWLAGQSAALARQLDRVLQVLDAWGYLEGWKLTERGEILSRVYHEADLLVAEAVASGALDGLDSSELAAAVSCFVYEHRSPGPPPAPRWPSQAVEHAVGRIARIADDLKDEERSLDLPETRQVDGGFCDVAHRWAAGQELSDVLEHSELTAGDFVRNVRQVVDLLRQLGQLAPTPATSSAARAAARSLDRGIVAASAALGDAQ